MSIWYALCEAMHLEFLHMTFMKNALLAILVISPLFGLMSTMVVQSHDRHRTHELFL